MNQIELLQNISKYLARFSEQVTILNANGEFSINIHAENLLISLLNNVLNLGLVNVNHNIHGNYPAIDLLDAKAKEAIQVTSTNKLEKVKSTIERFFRNGLYKDINHFKVFIITGKQKEYSVESIHKKISEEINILLKSGQIKQITDINFKFNPEKDILDKTDIYKILVQSNNIEKTIEAHKILKDAFDKIEEKENLLPYYQKLKNYYYDIVMDDENGLTLDQIYVEPSFQIFANTLKKDDPKLLSRGKNFFPVDSRYKLKEFVDETIEGQNNLRLSENYRMVLLLGYPGQGKSSFCKRFLNDYINAKKNNTKNVYYFTLRNIRQVRDFMFNPMNILYEEACSQTEIQLDKFDFYKSVLVLDGLDELYMRENLKLEEIDKLCKELSIEIEKHPLLFIILTSRYGYVDVEKIYKEKILICQLELFSFKSQIDWLQKFAKFHPETWVSEQKLKIFNTENKYKHLKELIEQPLLLHMVASIKEEINETTNRAKIYSQLFSELIDRKYSKEGQLEIFQKVTKDDLREVIREIAFGIFQTGNEFITKRELFNLEAAQNFLKLLPEDNLKDSIKGIMISFYFKEVEKKNFKDIDDKSNYAIEFLHKSLREYLTAEKIYTTLKTEFLEKRSTGKYFIDDHKSALTIIFSLFHNQDLPYEIVYHLTEIISNENDITKDELCNRLCLHFRDFLKNDFLLNFQLDESSYPIKKSLRCFSSFWTIVSMLNPKKNYLIDENAQKRFAELINLMSADEQEIESWNFNNQIFYNSIFSKCNFEYCTFKNCKFNSTSLTDVRFFNCVFKDVLFDNSFHYNTTFYNCKIDNAVYDSLDVHEMTIIGGQFTDVVFKNCDIDNFKFTEQPRQEFELILQKWKFEDVVMDQSSWQNINDKYPLSTNANISITKQYDSNQVINVEPPEFTFETEYSDASNNDYKRIV